MTPYTIQALATDYDETIADMGTVPPIVIAALERFRASGRKLVLDTGRSLHDLLASFPRVDLFHRVVVENGAVLYRPETGEEELLASPLPPAFLKDLERRGVSPIPARRVVLDTWAHHADAIRDAMDAAGLELSLFFNKSTLLALPTGVDKGTGLNVALGELGISPENTVGAGDEENDHALLEACGFAVAMPHAICTLKDRAHCVMPIVALIDAILADNGEPVWGPRGSHARRPQLSQR